MNTYNAMAGMSVEQVLVPADRTATFAPSSGIDISAYEGLVTIILNSAAGTGTSPTLDVKLQECDTTGGTYTDVSGATYTQVTNAAASVQKITVNAGDRKKFIALAGTIGGTSPHFITSATLVGKKKYA